jgi:hypothetical protein
MTDIHTMSVCTRRNGLSDLITMSNVLPSPMVNIVTGYLGTDSPAEILEMTRLFNKGEVYETIYFSTRPSTIIQYLNTRYKQDAVIGSICGYPGLPIPSCAFRFHRRGVSLNVRGFGISDDVGCLLTLSIS